VVVHFCKEKTVTNVTVSLREERGFRGKEQGYTIKKPPRHLFLAKPALFWYNKFEDNRKAEWIAVIHEEWR